MISIVVPVYYGEKTLDELCERVSSTVSKLDSDYELILVDDASPDGSKKKIRKLADEKYQVKGIFLSKNSGQHLAILAGLEHCKGDYVVVMDCDLQDRPEEISNLYKKLIITHSDMVLARRNIRQDNFLKKLSSVIFYKVFDYFVGSRTDASIGNFGIYKIEVIKSVIQTKSERFFFPAYVSSFGFTRDMIDVKHDISKRGFSTYSLYKLIRLAVPIIFSHSIKPLFFVTYFAFIGISSLSIFTLLEYYIWKSTSSFIPTVYTSLTLVSLNILMLSIYVGEIHKNNQKKLLYYIQEKVNI